MRIRICVLIITLIAIGGFTTVAQAQIFEAVSNTPAFSWTRFPPDARSEALGGAYMAVAEGAAGSWWNPAAPGPVR
jgi:hypothetical protein